MPFALTCPNPACSRALSVPEPALGRTARCRHCGHSFAVGRSAEMTANPDAGQTQGGAPASRAGADRPETLGRFRITVELGAGQFGTVYRAYDPQLDREVALKVPHADLLANPRVVTRFLREAKAAANLRHPNIVPVFESGKVAGGYYIARAFIDGRPLADEIPDGGLPFRRAAAVARELAGAVGYAHEQGVVHRDIKPANVMVDRTGRPHLMDFGLASRADEGSKLTTDGAILGTPAYMAPEQARGAGGEAGPAADQYAVGVVLYELLTGRVPFSGPAAIVIHNAIHTDPEPPAKHRPDTPADLGTICRKAMAKRPEERYATCADLADDLRRWLDGEPVAARPLGPVGQLVRWGRRNPAVAGLSAAVVALLAVGVLVASSLAVAAAREAKRADQAAADAVANRTPRRRRRPRRGRRSSTPRARRPAPAPPRRARPARPTGRGRP